MAEVWCASCAPTNYNQYATAKSYVQTRCAPCAPTNYNNQIIEDSNLDYAGAPHAHQRITTRVVLSSGPTYTRCAPCAPMNYNVVTVPDFQILRRCAPCAPMNYNSARVSCDKQLCWCAPCAPMNYNKYHRKIGKSTMWCAPYAPMNYNSSYATSAWTILGALRAHQRITTLMDWGSAAAPPGTLRVYQRITTVISLPSPTCWAGCALCVSTNYNTRFWNSFRQVFWVRLVRTNELQRTAHRGQRPRLRRCTSCAPMNYNIEAIAQVDKRTGAPRAHQRITTPCVSSGTKTEWVRFVRTNELQLP